MEDTKEQARDVIADVEVDVGGIPGGFVIGTETAATILAALAEAGLVIEQDWQLVPENPNPGDSFLLFDGEIHEGMWDEVDYAPYDMRDARGMPVMGWTYGSAEIDPSNFRPTLCRPLPASPTPAPAQE